MTQIWSRERRMCANGSRHSSLNGRSSSTPSTKLRKSLINISHRNFQSPICSVIYIVRETGVDAERQCADDWWLQHWHKSARTHFARVASKIDFVRLFGKCFTTRRRPSIHYFSQAQTISRIHTYHYRMLSPVSIHIRCVRARSAPDSVSLLIGLSGGNSSFFRRYQPQWVCYCCCPICHSVYASTTRQPCCGDE